MKKSRILLIDTSSVLHIVKHSGKKLVKKKDRPTYIIYGFLIKLQQLMKKTKANVCVFAGDSDPKDSIRKKILPSYKFKRQSKDKTLEEIELDSIAYPQFNEVIEKILPKMGYQNIFKTDRLEADDIIGSICKTHGHCEIIIVTTDQDMYQCISHTTCILNPKTMQYITKAKFQEKYGIEPNMWKRVKVISGCRSDEVPGIFGIGEKTVIKYLKGELSKKSKKYQAIESPENKKIIQRNKSLVILPFRGTPKYVLKEDTISKTKIQNMAKEYGFVAIESETEEWYRNLKGW